MLLDLQKPTTNLDALFETIIAEVPPPAVELDKPFQMQISALDYSSYVGTIGIGRIHRGTIKPSSVTIVDKAGNQRSGRIAQLLGYQGLDRYEIQEAHAGDISAVTGIEKLTYFRYLMRSSRNRESTSFSG